jgi:hypothetical protein
MFDPAVASAASIAGPFSRSSDSPAPISPTPLCIEPCPGTHEERPWFLFDFCSGACQALVRPGLRVRYPCTLVRLPSYQLYLASIEVLNVKVHVF